MLCLVFHQGVISLRTCISKVIYLSQMTVCVITALICAVNHLYLFDTKSLAFGWLSGVREGELVSVLHFMT